MTEPTLAYVFWHAPQATVPPVEYEAGLREFHAVLAQHPPIGFLGSNAYRTSRTPWGGSELGSVVYVDWYLLQDWAAVGELNRQAVAPPHGPRHDAVARHAAGAFGGIYRLLQGSEALDRVRFEGWSTRPRGTPSDAHARAMVSGTAPETTTIWQRQLVLGPAPEFCRRTRHAPTRSIDGEVRLELRPVSGGSPG